MAEDFGVFWTQAEVAKRWKCSEANVKNLRERGMISYFQFGRSIRYPREGILEFEKQQTKQKKGGARSKVNYIKRKPDVPPASPQQWRI